MNSEISVSELNRKFIDLEKRVSNIEDINSSTSKTISRKKVSINEFLIEKNPTDDVQKCLIIGYFLEIYDKLKSFTVIDLTEGFKLARETVPKNISDLIYKNVKKKGYFMEIGKKDGEKAYQLTNTGIKFVENGLKKSA